MAMREKVKRGKPKDMTSLLAFLKKLPIEDRPIFIHYLDDATRVALWQRIFQRTDVRRFRSRWHQRPTTIKIMQ